MVNEKQQWFLTLLNEQLSQPINGLSLLNSQGVDEKTLSKAIGISADALLERIRATAQQAIEIQQKTLQEFESHTSRIWGPALNHLELLLMVAVEAYEELGTEYSPAPLVDGEFALRVLMDLDARACQVGYEVLTLLKSGFPDGAYARWRTLHELVVTAYFIAQHGNDLAERYISHESIESYKAALEYQRIGQALGEPLLSEEEMSKPRSERDALMKKYGERFKETYGWASGVLRKDHPTFRDIEESVDFQNVRLQYQVASFNVHASAKGIMARLGVPAGKNLRLTGQSNYGLADPGQGTAVSISQITTVLLAQKESVPRALSMKTLELLAKETVKLFQDASVEFEHRAT